MITAAARPFISAHVWADAVWIVTWLAWILGETAQHTRRRREGATLSDRRSHTIFIVCMAPAVLLLILSRKIIPGATITPPFAAFVAGEIVFVAGAAIRLSAIRTLGAYFTTTVQTSSDQTVITSGPYRIVRHPSYTGLLLIALGGSLVYGNWLGAAAMVVLLTVALCYRIRVEEDALITALGDPYSSYASEHKRLIPGIW